MKKLKSYTSTQGKVTFDWNEFLNRKEISEYSWYLAKNRSQNWITCACGTQCNIIPRDVFGTPKDITLQRYGFSFNIAIRKKSKREAKKVLKLIEKRSSELIKEITTKSNTNKIK